MSIFNRFDELKDIYTLIISFTTGKDFCTMFSVCTKFRSICDELKISKSIFYETTIANSYNKSVIPITPYLIPLIQSDVRACDILFHLWKTDYRDFESKTSMISYRNIKIYDEYVDISYNRRYIVLYSNNKKLKSFYFRDDSQRSLKVVIYHDGYPISISNDRFEYDLEYRIVRCVIDSYIIYYSKY